LATRSSPSDLSARQQPPSATVPSAPSAGNVIPPPPAPATTGNRSFLGSLPARESFREAKYRVQNRLFNELDPKLDLSNQVDVRQQIEELFAADEEGLALTRAERVRMLEQITDEILGLGPLEGHSAHHRADRPPHRRVEPDGGRAASRRIPRERHHPAAEPRRPGSRWWAASSSRSSSSSSALPSLTVMGGVGI